MKSIAFIAAACVAVVVAGYSLEKYRGLGRRMPITAICLSISLLALAGLPPLNGFWSKLVLFGAAIDSGPLVEWGPYLAIAGVLNSALSLAYYAWIMRKMYMEESPDMSRAKEPKSMVAVMIFGAVFMVGFGIWHAPILEFASEALPNLSETMAQISTNSTGVGGGIGNSSSGTGIPGALSPLSATYILKNAS
jgi:NADH-quinone oxidoreductase subunit N